MYAIAIKLLTIVQCHKVTLLSKFHNYELNTYEIIALFYLKKSIYFLVNINYLITMYAIAFKLCTPIQCSITLNLILMKLLPLFT